MVCSKSGEEIMYLGIPDNFSLNGSVLFQQGLAGRFVYQGPTVVADKQLVPSIGVQGHSVEPVLLTGDNVGGQLAGKEIKTALEPLISAAPKAGANAFGLEGSHPQGAAQQVLSAIGQALGSAQQRGASQSELQALAQQARTGVEQGLGEARNILAGLGLESSDVTAQVDETQSELEQGLAALEAQFVPPTPVVVEQSLQVASSRAQSLSLEITTRDGDTVVLSLARSQARYQEAFLSNTEGTVTIEVQSASYASANFSLSVDGQLDESELEAIQGLIKKVDKLADKFFEGHVQAAFAQVSHLELDAEELVSLTLDLELTRLRQASSSYQSVGALDVAPVTASEAVQPPVASPPPSLTDTLNTLSGLFHDVQAAIDTPELDHAFDKPSRIFRQLLGGAIELHPAYDEAAALDDEAAGVSPGALLDSVSAVLAGEKAEDVHEHHRHHELLGHEDRDH